MDNIEDLLNSIELESSWTEKLNKACPSCGSELEFSDGLTSPNTARAYCANCGFSALMTAPRSDIDDRWVEEDVEV